MNSPTVSAFGQERRETFLEEPLPAVNLSRLAGHRTVAGGAFSQQTVEKLPAVIFGSETFVWLPRQLPWWNWGIFSFVFLHVKEPPVQTSCTVQWW